MASSPVETVLDGIPAARPKRTLLQTYPQGSRLDRLFDVSPFAANRRRRRNPCRTPSVPTWLSPDDLHGRRAEVDKAAITTRSGECFPDQTEEPRAP
jgi:hypothetical protein